MQKNRLSVELPLLFSHRCKCYWDKKEFYLSGHGEWLYLSSWLDLAQKMDHPLHRKIISKIGKDRFTEIVNEFVDAEGKFDFAGYLLIELRRADYSASKNIRSQSYFPHTNFLGLGCLKQDYPEYVGIAVIPQLFFSSFENNIFSAQQMHKWLGQNSEIGVGSIVDVGSIAQLLPIAKYSDVNFVGYLAEAFPARQLINCDLTGLTCQSNEAFKEVKFSGISRFSAELANTLNFKKIIFNNGLSLDKVDQLFQSITTDYEAMYSNRFSNEEYWLSLLTSMARFILCGNFEEFMYCFYSDSAYTTLDVAYQRLQIYFLRYADNWSDNEELKFIVRKITAKSAQDSDNAYFRQVYGIISKLKLNKTETHIGRNLYSKECFSMFATLISIKDQVCNTSAPKKLRC